MAENTPLPWVVGPFGDIYPASDIEIIDGSFRERCPRPRIIAMIYGTPFLPDERSTHANLIASSVNEHAALVARSTQDAETIQALREQLDAADRFRMLFVTDSDPVSLTLEVDTLDLANAFDELSKASATARAALSAGRA